MLNARSWSFRLLRIHRTSDHCLLESIVFLRFRQPKSLDLHVRLTSLETCILNRSQQKHQRLYFLQVLERSGVAPNFLIQVFSTCIRSVEYACQVWNYGTPDYLKEEVERIQNMHCG